MAYGKINPTINDYIGDLLADNQSLFANSYATKERIKELERERHLLEKGTGDIKLIAELTGRIYGLYLCIKRNFKEIKDNLNKVEGLKNGTIKEI